jgi:hypothetical protein
VSAPDPPPDPDRGPDHAADAHDDAAGVDAAAAPATGAEGRGTGIVNFGYVATGLFVVSSTAALVFPHDLAVVAAIVDLVLFAVGCAAFLWAYAVAVGRSREEEIVLAGLFFLSGSAPKPVALRLRSTFAVQVVVAVAAAAIRPFTPLAFGVLVPVLGLGLMGLWGARFGSFAPRPPRPVRTARASPAPGASTPDSEADQGTTADPESVEGDTR